MVVNDHEETTIAACADNAPLCPPLIDGSISMAFLNCLNNIMGIEITFA